MSSEEVRETSLGQLVGQHRFLLLDADPVEHVDGLGLGVVVGLDLLFEEGEEKGLQVEVAVQKAELLEDDFSLLETLCAFVLAELLIQVAFNGGASGDLALYLAFDGQAGLLRREFDEFVDQRKELLCLLGRNVGRIRAGRLRRDRLLLRRGRSCRRKANRCRQGP